MRRFHTDDAGYALAIRLTWTSATSRPLGTAARPIRCGHRSDAARLRRGRVGQRCRLTDAGIRRVIQDFDDDDVPGRDAIWSSRRSRSVAFWHQRFTEQAFTGEAGAGNSIRNATWATSTRQRVRVEQHRHGRVAEQRPVPRLLVLPEAVAGSGEQMASARRLSTAGALGTLVTADRLYGVKTVRSTAGVMAIIVPRLS